MALDNSSIDSLKQRVGELATQLLACKRQNNEILEYLEMQLTATRNLTESIEKLNKNLEKNTKNETSFEK